MDALDATLPDPGEQGLPVPQREERGIIASPLDRLISAATDPRVDVDKMERLLDIADKWKAKEAAVAYADALADMQPDLPEVKKRGDADRYKYALWEDIQESLRPVLFKHGFSLSFRTERPEQGWVRVTAVLLHRAGHSESTDMVLPLDDSGRKNVVQATGSAVSYGKRYTAQALLNLTARGEDDDGQAAGARGVDTGEVIMPADADLLRELVAEIGRTEAQLVAVVNAQFKLSIATLDDLPAGHKDAVLKFLRSKKTGASE